MNGSNLQKMQIGHHQRRATLKMRRGDGWHIKPEIERHDGAALIVSDGWAIDTQDSAIYAGERAWLIDEPRSFPVAWVAEGDLAFAQEDGAHG